MEDLTKSEKAAIYFHLLEKEKNVTEIYKIAIGADRFNALKESAQKNNSYRWKNSQRIKDAYNEIIARLENIKNQIKQEAQQQSQGPGDGEGRKEDKKKQPTTQTDFLNRDEFLQFLNARANEIDITDDKTRNDILKMLSDNLRYKDADKEDQTEIQRFYTPLTCQDCEIYNKCRSCKADVCTQERKIL